MLINPLSCLVWLNWSCSVISPLSAGSIWTDIDQCLIEGEMNSVSRDLVRMLCVPLRAASLPLRNSVNWAAGSREEWVNTGHFTEAGGGGASSSSSSSSSSSVPPPPPTHTHTHTGSVTSAGCIRVAVPGQRQKIRRPVSLLMKMVSSCRLRCLLLLLLSFTASISCSSAAQRDSKLRLLLHRTPLLGSKQVRDTQRHSDRQTDRQTETFYSNFTEPTVAVGSGAAELIRTSWVFKLLTRLNVTEVIIFQIFNQTSRVLIEFTLFH